MRRIVLVPLDERPCNYYYPQLLGRVAGIDVVVPPEDLLGRKKRPADRHELGDWLMDQAPTVDGLVASVDMLAYGGLVPSRVSDISCEDALSALVVLKRIRQARPDLPIFGHSVIMRVPAYNSADEEPDYWAEYGTRLNLYSMLLDVVDRGPDAWRRISNGDAGASLRSAIEATAVELAQAEGSGTPDDGGAGMRPGDLPTHRALEQRLAELRRSIPAEVREDWHWRRERNHRVNEEMIRWAAAEIFDFLALTQDDSSLLGLPALEQRHLGRVVSTLHAYRKVLIYPGADEVGMLLTARQAAGRLGIRPRVWLRFSSQAGPGVVPRYEDRPLLEGVKSQVVACGGFLASSPESAQIHLFVNSPGGPQAEAIEQDVPGRDYGRNRNLAEFLEALSEHCAALRTEGRVIALADVAYANGADRDLVEMLPYYVYPLDLDAFAAWNTAANTIGTSLAHACLRHVARRAAPAGDSGPSWSSPGIHEQQALDRAHHEFLMLRFAEDWAYQALVRQQVTTELLNASGISPQALGPHRSEVSRRVLVRLNEVLLPWINAWTSAPRENPRVELYDLSFPWDRLFEIKLVLRVDASSA